ncbi:MAG TPA: C45 family peptidase [Candidatus Limnocylindria bacterium]|jgi:isopenicillin-N N-acyltransferase-like protein|nr:C45 family peptidase [Candidatus Limnocylindria bacterium]
MTVTALPTIEISGDRRTLGRQHGEAARGQIRDSIAYYRQSFQRISGLGWEEIRSQAPRWISHIEEYLPGIGDELEGISEGAGAGLEEILALNARGELSSGNPFASDPDEGCSSYALLLRASGDGHVYCGQNWDWRGEIGSTVILLRISQPGKPTIVMQTEAGQIGRHGANSAGIALNANGLGTRWGKGVGLPQPFIRRKILEAPDMQAALKAVFDSRQSLCTNLLITHRDGFAIDLETTPDRHGWMYPTDGLLVHTNHFIAFVPEQIAATYRPFSVNSLWRLPRLTEGLRKVKNAADPESVRGAIGTALRDHFGYPNSVCKHGDARSVANDQNQTIASSIVDLTTGEYWLASGNPCETEYRRLPWNLYQEATASARPLAAIR